MALSNRQPPVTGTQPTAPHEMSTLQWVVSFLFWGQLLLAGGLYGAVALAPKLSNYVHLRGEFHTNQVQLVQLEETVEELKKVTEALESDPDLLEELARIDLDATRPGEERIPLQNELTLQSRIKNNTRAVSPETDEWYSPLLTAYATDHRLRRVSLLVAASLVIAAFTFFQPSQVNRFSTGLTSIRESGSSLTARYRSR